MVDIESFSHFLGLFINNTTFEVEQLTLYEDISKSLPINGVCLYLRNYFCLGHLINAANLYKNERGRVLIGMIL